MLYRVTLWEPDPYAPGYNLVRSWIEGSKNVANIVVRDELGTAFESAYGTRVNRRPFAEITPVRRYKGPSMVRFELRACGPTETVEQPFIIVPSVGELGYTP